LFVYLKVVLERVDLGSEVMTVVKYGVSWYFSFSLTVFGHLDKLVVVVVGKKDEDMRNKELIVKMRKMR
jgi:hypothetical protein